MELLFEIIIDLVVGGSIEGANDDKLPKGVRVVLLILSSLIYTIFTAFFVRLLLTSDSIFLKIIAAGMVLFFVGGIIFLWRKVIKARK